MHERRILTTDAWQKYCLIDKFCHMYNNDNKFIGDLGRLCEKYSPWADAWVDGVACLDFDEQWWQSEVSSYPEWRSFRRDIDALASQWGLKSGVHPYGEQALDDWFLHNLGVEVDKYKSFSFLVHGFYGVHPLNDVGEQDEHLIEEWDVFNGNIISYAYFPIVPRVHIHIEDVWHGTRESPADARARLIAVASRQIDAEIARLSAAYEAENAIPYSPSSVEDEHLRWLYHRVAYRETCDEIVATIDRGERDAYNVDSIRHASTALAELMGIKIPRPLRNRTFK